MFFNKRAKVTIKPYYYVGEPEIDTGKVFYPVMHCDPSMVLYISYSPKVVVYFTTLKAAKADVDKRNKPTKEAS